MGAIIGCSACLALKRDGFNVGSVLFPVLLVAAGIAVERMVTRKLCEFEKQRNAMRRGADGEREVAMMLERLPDTFIVINDLATPSGNIDHVVIGPTGVYIIDAKNWRGLVAADGKKEILLNGKQPSKPAVKSLVRTIMSAQEKVRVLTGFNPFVQGVLAFTAAYVEAPFGSTGCVHCVCAEHLLRYIVDRRSAQKWSPDKIEKIVSAFAALSQMETPQIPDTRTESAPREPDADYIKPVAIGARR